MISCVVIDKDLTLAGCRMNAAQDVDRRTDDLKMNSRCKEYGRVENRTRGECLVNGMCRYYGRTG